MSRATGFTKGLRRFLADLSFEVFLYAGLISAAVAWWQTGLVYVAIACFVVVTAVLGFISYRLIDAQQSNNKPRSWWPLFGVIAVIAIGSLSAYLWQYFA
ncbi:hypothetical protein WG68_13400 [Arsukibacterium ikkense]|uniref:Uncharacterized protein n=1 Tax=Arsukibacterium ikkense TaxID=336831 RepID=A0A0M2V6P6_9GAMM|nr:hypothetical protein [Arsukibacterium ikkense]KKO44828.1 hypothetical protein WG68_13400 [Arsukibacterium ikkense]